METTTIISWIDDELQAIVDRGQLRSLKTVQSASGPWVTLDGRQTFLLCSNNYLGLANHPRMKDTARAAIEKYGTGAGAARLISGNHPVYEKLESRLAEFGNRESALIFGSGYLVNIGVIPALAGKGDTILSDAFNHASLIDGCRLSRAKVHIFRHNDMNHLEDLLQTTQTDGRKLVVFESLYSMEGDRAPLEEIVQLAERYGAMTLADEAHAFGCLGQDGRGLAAELDPSLGAVDIVMATFGKALGSYGAFAQCSQPMRDYLINRARSFIFDTALPPAVLAAVDSALDIIKEEKWRQSRLAQVSTELRNQLIEMGYAVTGKDHILPVLVGEESDTVRLAGSLQDQGVFAPAIRPPSVPPGTSRLRVTVSADHTEEDIRFVTDAFGKAGHPAS